MFVKSKICSRETDSYPNITMPLQHMRLIHTSDTHLGDHLGHPSSNNALQKVVSETILLGADFLLLAGDVFDNERISDETVKFFLDEISKLDTPVILLPGNHDLMHDTSIYKRGIFKDSPSNLFIFKEENGEIISEIQIAEGYSVQGIDLKDDVLALACGSDGVLLYEWNGFDFSTALTELGRLNSDYAYNVKVYDTQNIFTATRAGIQLFQLGE